MMRTLKIYSINNFHVKFTDVFIGGVSDKEPTCQCRRHERPGLHPGSGIFPREGNGNPLQYSCLGNPMDRGAWLGPQGCKRIGATKQHLEHVQLTLE